MLHHLDYDVLDEVHGGLSRDDFLISEHGSYGGADFGVDLGAFNWEGASSTFDPAEVLAQEMADCLDAGGALEMSFTSEGMTLSCEMPPGECPEDATCG